MGVLEGQMFKKIRKLVSLSEQQLVDCSFDFGNNGCGGGTVHQAFEYVKQSGGLQTEKSYPYKNKEQKCKFDPQKASATCSNYESLSSGDEDHLQRVVGSIGPVSVATDTRRCTFQLYESGVYDDQYYSRTKLTHAVLVVGYNTEDKGQDYWLVKNSYGVKWGNKGYIKMSRNKDNQCGIATRAVYPVV